MKGARKRGNAKKVVRVGDVVRYKRKDDGSFHEVAMGISPPNNGHAKVATPQSPIFQALIGRLNREEITVDLPACKTEVKITLIRSF